MSQKTLTALLLAATMTPGAIAGDTVTFELIPDAISANDLTPDGRYVVGQTFNQIYRYDTVTGEMLILPGPAYDVVAISDDGSVILGEITNEKLNVTEAAIWNEADDTWTGLGILDTCDFFGTSPYELSADGTRAVGLAWNGCSGRGFLWTEENGMQELEGLANGNNRASVMSSDGTVIGGFAQGSFSRTPAIWDDTTAGMLLDPPDGDVLGEVFGISDDGSTLLCRWDGDAVQIVDGGEPEVLGMGSVFPGWNGTPMDIADDEGTIVGFDIIQTLRSAWIRPVENNPMGSLIDLEDWIEDNGGDTLGTDLQVVQAISRDGSLLIGHGFLTGAWLVRIGGDCPADTNGDDTVNVEDLVNVILAWGTDDTNADVNADGTVDVQDLVEVILAWGDC